MHLSRYGLPVAIALIALGMAPLVFLYLELLWEQEHYQFYPVLLVAVGALLYSRWNLENVVVPQAPENDVDDEERGPSLLVRSLARLRPLAALTIVAAGMAVQFASFRLFHPLTPWGGYLGFVIAGAGIVAYLGLNQPQSLIPAWALMALIVMPPQNFDDTIITWLQHRTASFSSRLLDVLGVDHVREGVLIEIASKTLFVEEACSGVQSLFSLMAVAAVLAVWHRRPLVHTVLLLISAFLGAGAMNVLRTVAIVYGLDQVGIDLLSEPQHTILGLAMFIFALGWLLCCDSLLKFLLSPIDVADPQMMENWWVILWNRFLAGFRWRRSVQIVRRGPVVRWICRAMLVFLAVSGVVLGVMSTQAVLASRVPGQNPLDAPVEPGEMFSRFSSLEEDSLPAEFEGWKRIGFEAVERKEMNAFGQYSRIWHYSTPFGRASCSVDYPFRGWHDLKICYSGVGWLTSGVETESSIPSSGVVDITQFSMQKVTGETALVVFAAMNERLEPVASREFGGLSQTFFKRVQTAISQTENMEVIAQFQILSSSPAKSMGDADLRDINRHLVELRTLLIEHLRKEDQKP